MRLKDARSKHLRCTLSIPVTAGLGINNVKAGLTREVFEILNPESIYVRGSNKGQQKESKQDKKGLREGIGNPPSPRLLRQMH
ncbi:hypothetical protein HYFRA_00010238 [Hymenoscyphus fraxineus]|uniref:Uncharacterized protein n=1 Tax=Hymenoscyphus fraxineus TaxID=746836 RepID=A0A9N9KVP7_9HELO|nr:hypothetical protein HYFRA_00010238 [Hymenoscyphus fraxineus]